MKQIVFYDRSLDPIRLYISNLKSYYFDLYSDTGLWNEEWMLDEYEKKSELLYTIIIDAVTEKMSVEIIPYEIMVTSFRKAVFTIERRRIVVIYEES
jgi:hypothetical protein